MKKLILHLSLLIPCIGFAQSYSIDWLTVSGGGSSTGAGWSVSGSAGQGEARRSSGGDWTVQGGFWNRVTGNLAPVAQLAAFSRAKNSSLKIRISDLVTNAFDWDGETPAFASTDGPSTNGAAISSDANFVYYNPPGGGNVTDRFTYRVRDGFQGLGEGTVVITILDPANGQSFNIRGITALPDGNRRIDFAGIPGRNYLIQAATNLSPPISWSTVSTNVAGSDGLWSYVDLQATNFNSRYYRSAVP